MPKEYIERGAILDAIAEGRGKRNDTQEGTAIEIWGEIKKIPAANVISRELFEQIKWERDIAMQQLEEHGIAFGEKKTADVVEVVRKPIRGYEEHYVVDQFGRVYGIERTVTVVDGGRVYEKIISEKQMKQSLHTKGYKTVTLTKDGKSRTCFVHRIVAEAFIDNSNELPMVNHKDEDKTNNFVENLEWCTASYNRTYGKAVEKQAKALRGKKHTAEHKRKISESVKKHYENDFCSYGERKDEGK